MKKLFSITLLVVLCLTMAVGCDKGNNNSENGNNNNNADNGNNDNVNIPNNGTAPTVKEPLKSHAGDEGYFYTTTDDYIVYSKTIVGYNYTQYTIQSFDINGVTDVKGNFVKLVFENNSLAKEFADSENETQNKKGYIAIDNVVYLTDASGFSYDFKPGRSYYQTKSALADFLSEKTFYYDQSSYDDYYMSKP